MNIPKKIKIGWKEYEIEQVDEKGQLIVDAGTCYGEIEYDDQVIRLNKNYGDEQKKATLIHEILHGISNMYTLDMTEDLVTKLANALYIVMKDNPNLFNTLD